MAIIFMIVAPAIILYSQGYRFDVKKMMFVETGAIYLKVYPEEATIFLDNEKQKETSFFSRDLLIQNLLPQNYLIRIEKEGYHSWEKNIEVQVGLASEAKYITMFKKDNPFNLIKEDIENFFPSLDGDRFFLLTSSNEIYEYKESVKELKRILNKTQTPYNISNITFSNNRNALIETSTGLYYLLTPDNQISLIKSFSSEVKNIYFDPKDEDYFIYQIGNSIYRFNPKTEKTPKLISREKIDHFNVLNNDIIALSNKNIILLKDLTEPEEIILNGSFEYKEESLYEILIIENYLFLLEDKKNLYFFNKENKSFELKLEALTEIKYTPFFNKILFYDNNKIWLMFLKKEDSPFFKEAYEIIELSNYLKKIDNLKWLNGFYFILTINNGVFISEIDNRNNINILKLDKENTSKIFFNGNIKKVFLLDQKSFLVSENKILP